ELYKLKSRHNFTLSHDVWRENLQKLVQLLAPFAPHITEELWADLGHDESVHISAWPEWDEELVKDELLTVAVQINGKVRAEILVSADADRADVLAQAKADEKVAGYLKGQKIKKEIYVPGRLVSLVI
ncbi:MAG TPA: class I tRNA ligase family protein, partial [Candidatus Saccharimonadales bacterium]|nr:class I tRNA ligase family protein [Candidatus Saccharimonadales bacterium]